MADHPDLETKVLKWMNSTGFPLEMAAANAFRHAKFEVRQSSTYVDPESGKGREIDVVVTDPDWIGAVDIGFVLECKSSARPWVVLRSDDAFANYNRFSAFAPMTESARAALVGKAPGFNSGCLASMKYIERPSDGGYGLRQALDGADQAYAAAIGAVKACVHLVQECESLSYKPAAIYFPVIAVDSPIYECTLLANGELALEEVSHSEFLFVAHIPGRIGCWVRIVGKADLPRYAAWARELANTLRADLKDQEERVLGTLNQEDAK